MGHHYLGNRRPLVDDTTAYEYDVVAQAIVALYPHGATLEIIAEVLSVSRERVRQIEAEALGKLVASCRRLKIRPEHLLGAHFAGALDVVPDTFPDLADEV